MLNCDEDEDTDQRSLNSMRMKQLINSQDFMNNSVEDKVSI